MRGRRAPLSPRTLPHHAGIALQRAERLCAIGPFRRFLQVKMVARLAARAGFENGARDVHPFWCALALIGERGSADGAEASRRARGLVLVAADVFRALRHAKAALPGANISGVSATLCAAAGLGMVVPGPERGRVNLQPHRPAGTPRHGNGGGFLRRLRSCTTPRHTLPPPGTLS